MRDHHHDGSALTGVSERKRMLLASLLAERERRPGGPAAVERLRAGSGDPIVLVHPVGGNILSYVELVRHLAGGPPVVALAADSLLAERVPSMPELAAHYVERLDRAGIRPALLAGWSFGGVVAFEMARQLAARDVVCPTVLLDSMPAEPGQVGQDRDETGIAQLFVEDLVRSADRYPHEFGLTADAALWRQPTEDAELGAEQAVLRAERHLAEHGFVVGLPADALLARYRTYRNAVRTLDTYLVPPHAHPVLLVHATRGDDDPPSVWGPVCAALAVHTIDTDHYDLMRPPFVRRAAELVGDAHAGTTRVS
jgi:thioesterase domain-containing protein